MVTEPTGEKLSLRVLLVHLRFGWSLMLMPFFLWGFYLSGQPIAPAFWLGLFLFHVPFYGGSVAFNSYYDQDEGPICGLWAPPKAGREVLVFSLAIQLLGLPLLLLINWPIFILGLVLFAMSTAYSHPSVRLKAHPIASVLTVSLGQGLGGVLAGWLCGRDDLQGLFEWPTVLGLLMTILLATGFYPLIQLFQRQEDRQRGDFTFAVRYGRASFPFAIACLVPAGAAGATLLWLRAGPWHGALMGLGVLGAAGLIRLWWRSFDETLVRQNYLWMMRLGYLLAGGLGAYLIWQLIE